MSFVDISYLELLVGAGGGMFGMYVLGQALKNAQDKNAEVVNKLINGVNERLDTVSNGMVQISNRVDGVNNKLDAHMKYCKSVVGAKLES